MQKIKLAQREAKMAQAKLADELKRKALTSRKAQATLLRGFMENIKVAKRKEKTAQDKLKVVLISMIENAKSHRAAKKFQAKMSVTLKNKIRSAQSS